MIDEKQRQEYEDNAVEVVTKIYKTINPSVEIAVPTDPYCHWDMTATVNGVEYKAENKTRNLSYKAYKAEGYYLDANKVDGTIDLFNYYFPQDNVLMITNYDKIKDITPKDTFIHKDVYCDKDSGSKIKKNIVIPYEKFWVYDTTENKLISKPKKR